MRRLRLTDAAFAADYAALIAARAARLDDAEEAVRPVVRAVRDRGMAAVIEATEKFDGLRLSEDEMRVGPADIAAARAACPSALLAALELAALRIAAFHAWEQPGAGRRTDPAGLTTGARWTAVDAAGLYVPGGKAAYPSSVLMNAIPARAAGVKRLAMATPPGRAASNPAILAAADIAGVTEIWRIGGAQAIAALAYGAGPLAACDVVVGPGNAFVTAAKKIVFGDVGVDGVAGPSEVFILATGDVDPRWIAADLLAQAEHDEDAQSVLFTPDSAFAEAVDVEVARQIAAGEAGAPAAASIARCGAIVETPSLAAALPFVDQAAPEHVQIIAPDAEALAASLRHAGAIFLGAFAPEAVGDYVAGPSHVLPTARAARYASGVSVYTFMKRTSIIAADAAALALVGPAAAAIADAEGLIAHAASIRWRLGHG
ncbi:MAG: histidinol dehydrogenase [Caulobacterales bacterium]|jgi:histidinol dehydrogenase